VNEGARRLSQRVLSCEHGTGIPVQAIERPHNVTSVTYCYTKGRKERPLAPFSNFRAIKGIAKIRELNQRSFFVTVGITSVTHLLLLAGEFSRQMSEITLQRRRRMAAGARPCLSSRQA
jgi:hypothetical protein